MGESSPTRSTLRAVGELIWGPDDPPGALGEPVGGETVRRSRRRAGSRPVPDRLSWEGTGCPASTMFMAGAMAVILLQLLWFSGLLTGFSAGSGVTFAVEAGKRFPEVVERLSERSLWTAVATAAGQAAVAVTTATLPLT